MTITCRDFELIFVLGNQSELREASVQIFFGRPGLFRHCSVGETYAESSRKYWQGKRNKVHGWRRHLTLTASKLHTDQVDNIFESTRSRLDSYRGSKRIVMKTCPKHLCCPLNGYRISEKIHHQVWHQFRANHRPYHSTTFDIMPQIYPNSASLMQTSKDTNIIERRSCSTYQSTKRTDLADPVISHAQIKSPTSWHAIAMTSRCI